MNEMPTNQITESLIRTLVQFSDVGIGTFAAIAAVVSIISAFRSGVLRSIRIGSLEIQASERDVREAKEIIRSVTAPSTGPVPFETAQLANYYAQVLAQSKTSFWFSLVFASIGFLIIVLA